MKIGRSVFILLAIFILFASISAYANEYKLIFTESGPRVNQYFRVGKDGVITVPLASKTGKLKFKVKNRKLYQLETVNGQVKEVCRPQNKEFKVPVLIGQKECQYPLQAVYVHERGCSLLSRAALGATVGNDKILLLDQDLNGRFDDLGKDQIYFSATQKQIPLTKHILLNNKIVALTFSPDYSAIITKPYSGKTAELKIDTQKDWQISVDLRAEDNSFYASVKSSETILLLPGKYTISQVAASKLAEETEDDSIFKAFDAEPEIIAALKGYQQKEQKVLSLKAGVNKVALGAPFKLEFDCEQSGPKMAQLQIDNVSLRGIGGEQYRASIDGSKGKHSLKSYAVCDSQQVMLSVMEYG